MTGCIATYANAHGGYGARVARAPSPAPPLACASPEREPNDGYASAGAFTTTACGALAAGDQDGFTWSVGAGTVSDPLDLRASGDAQMTMGKLVHGQYVQIANDTTTSFVKQSTSAGAYVVGVWSASGATQGHALTLTKAAVRDALARGGEGFPSRFRAREETVERLRRRC